MRAFIILIIISCAIIISTIFNMLEGPAINQMLYESMWSISICQYYFEEYRKDIWTNEEYILKKRKCTNKRIMYNMELTSSIFNLFIGIVCLGMGIYGLGEKISKSPKIGFTGIGFGIVGFNLTLVYVIYNGIVYFNYYNDYLYKTDEQGAFAEYNEKLKAYECLYYKKDDIDAIFPKYYDLLKSQYNFNYDLIYSFNFDPEKKGCSREASPPLCQSSGYFFGNFTYGNGSLCTKYYYNQKIDDFYNYGLSVRFLICFILSIIILLFYFVLIFSGFMLFGKKKSRKEIKTKKNDDSYFLFFRVSVSEKIILN